MPITAPTFDLSTTGTDPKEATEGGLETAINAALASLTSQANTEDTASRSRANHTGTQSADTITDGSTNKAFTATEKTKLAGVASGATANDTDANLKARANHTGTQSADTITDGTTNKAFTAAEKTKLGSVATGATANDTDANLLARANHTGTQAKSTITGLQGDLDSLYDAVEEAVSLSRQPHPGLNPGLFKRGLDQGSASWGDADTVASSLGRALRVTGPGYVVLGELVPLNDGDTDHIHFAMRRAVNVVDPAGDAIVVGVACYDSAGVLLGGSAAFMALGANITGLNVAGDKINVGGRVTRSGTPPDDLPSIILPTNARYYAPVLRAFGENPGLDVIQVERFRDPSSVGPSVIGNNAAGPLAGRSAYNGEDSGFTYVATDSSPWQYYIRVGATAGVWAGPQTFQGPQGAAGPGGDTGFATFAEALAWLQSGTKGEGTTFSVAGVPFRTASASTALPHLPGAVPHGWCSPRHWSLTLNDAAILGAWAYFQSVMGTGTAAVVAASGGLTWKFTGHLHNAGGPLITLTTAGFGQLIEAEPEVNRLNNIRIVVADSQCTVRYLQIEGLANAADGITLTPRGSKIRGGNIYENRIRGALNGIRTVNDADVGWVRIHRNFLEDNERAVRLDRAVGITLTENELVSSALDGMVLYRGGELRAIGNRFRGNGRAGLRLDGSTATGRGQVVVENYLLGNSFSGNYANDANRKVNAIVSAASNGAGGTRLTLNVATERHWVSDGLIGCKVTGTGLYDGTWGVGNVTNATVDINTPFLGTATGSFLDPGNDVEAIGDAAIRPAQCNDTFIGDCNINGFYAKDAFGIMGDGGRWKSRFFLDGGCYNVRRVSGGRGRFSSTAVDDDDDGIENGTWTTVPITGQNYGFAEEVSLMGSGWTDFKGMVTRVPDPSVPLVGNMVQAYFGLTIDEDSGLVLRGPISLMGMVTGTGVTQSRTDQTPGRLLKRGDALLMRAVGPLMADAADGSPLLAVIDSGRTPNGLYQLFADGTLHCRHTLTASAAGAVTWSFPYPFSAPPNVNGTAEATVLAGVMQDGAPTARAASLSVRDKTDARLAVPMHLNARGRWSDVLGDVDFIRSLGAAVIYDFTNPATLWQENGGTTPVTGAAQTIGLIHDVGAGGFHMTQAASGQRPVTAINEFGRMVAVGDGVDDVLASANVDWSAVGAATMVIALRKVSDGSATAVPFSHGGTSTPNFHLRAPNGTNANVQMTTNTGTLVGASIAAPAPVSLALVGRLNLVTPTIQISQDGATWITSGTDPGAEVLGNVPMRLFGSSSAGAGAANAQIAFAAMIPAFVTDAQAARLWRIARGKWGFTL